MRRKNQVQSKTFIQGNGHTVQLSDVLNYFRGKTPTERECVIETVRAVGDLGWMPEGKRRGRPPLARVET